jgi:DNA-binding NarL/FixJ family response regulator
VTPLRIVAVDDHPLFLKGLAALVDSRDDVTLVGTAENADDAIALITTLQPDVAIVDLQMPGPGGIELTTQITAHAPTVRVLILTMFEDDVSVMAAIRAGARGYILKGARQDQLMHAIHSVAGGDTVFGPSVADRIARLVLTPSSDSAATAFPELTERELEVLDLVARGHSNGDIARRLFLSDKTVRNHVSNVLAKVSAPDRAALIVRAREAGFGAT